MIKNIFSSFGASADIQYRLDEPENSSRLMTLAMKKQGSGTLSTASPPAIDERLPIFHSKENIKGRLTVTVQAGKKIEHNGMKLEMIGQIEVLYDKGNNYEFTSSVRDLETLGTLEGSKEYDFDFSAVEKIHDSYNGINVRVRYFLRTTISRSLASNIVKEQEIWVQNLGSEPEVNSTIKMEVGIEDCLHIEFEYNKAKYHLQDVVIGKVYFLLVRIRIRHMELAILRREVTGSGPNAYNESENVTRFEIMDGAPVRGESIPVRLYLQGFDLTPTYRNVNNKFSVKYFLNLVLIDEEDRRYFKQQEIVLWRKNIAP